MPRSRIKDLLLKSKPLLIKGRFIVKLEKCKPKGCSFREMCVIEGIEFSPFSITGLWFNLDTNYLARKSFPALIDNYDKTVTDLREPTKFEIKQFKNIAKPLMLLRRL